MSYWTPSTEEIRGYATFGPFYTDEFDRWLSKHEVEVAEAERERIIYILENIPPGSGTGGDDVSLAIEIIEGAKSLEDFL